ncbi:hypothetical protein M885DRAFT_550709 [Pelagophyceae sp. CCMP2097]|nr:hypothetical protein M885DRAFT_550709 [Pelagophyceae sp. CCMP2097]
MSLVMKNEVKKWQGLAVRSALQRRLSRSCSSAMRKLTVDSLSHFPGRWRAACSPCTVKMVPSASSSATTRCAGVFSALSTASASAPVSASLQRFASARAAAQRFAAAAVESSVFCRSPSAEGSTSVMSLSQPQRSPLDEASAALGGAVGCRTERAVGCRPGVAKSKFERLAPKARPAVFRRGFLEASSRACFPSAMICVAATSSLAE